MPSASADDLSRLCQACGACCDGTLFTSVAVFPEEVASARRHALPLFQDDRAFTQPCVAHLSGSCSIYEDRPSTCRKFRCRLYERHEAEGGPLEARLVSVRRLRELRSRLKSGGVDVTAMLKGGLIDVRAGLSARPANSEALLDLAELGVRLERDFAKAGPTGPSEDPGARGPSG